MLPKQGILFYHKELVEAEKAVEEAQKAGKDKQCPEAFNDAKNMKDNAFKTYWVCRTDEARKLAQEATNKAKALCLKPVAVAKELKVIDRMTLMINFGFNKSNIRKADQAELKRAIEFIKKYPKTKIQIEGHTDDIGSEKYNQKLSERRATTVKKYLVKEGGIDAARLTTVGYGETKPVASNKTKEGRAKNRRVEILILSE
jgi:outer membrane protein OmpA-like peptidoglycan-associated protein